MKSYTGRFGALTAMSLALGLGLYAQPAAAQKTLTIIPHADLRVLDPLQAAATITTMHATNIYDQLFAWDVDLQPMPQMVSNSAVSADKLTYTMTLRPGLKWHDGTAVTTKDIIASINRWMKRDPIGRKMGESVAGITATDANTFVIKMKQPYAWVEYSLGNHAGNFPAMMREKEAMVDPFTAVPNDAQIGSGPFKFVASEWKPGSEVVYVKNPDYVPRSEPPNAMAGGKQAKVDRLVFKVIPDANTAANALLKSEVDMIDMPAGDILPLLEANKDIVVQKVHPVGGFGFFRPNGLHPPFNNIKARQALALIASQEDFLAAGFGDKKWWNECYSFFVCKSAYGTEVGSEPYRKVNREKAKQLLAEAGYKGEKIYVLGTKEIAHIGAITEVLVDGLRKTGVNVELEMMDWGTMVTRFGGNKNKPGESGGWHLWSASGSWSTWHNPLTNLGTNMSTDSSWAGWAADEETEKLRNAFIAAQTKEERMAVLDKLHRRLWEVVPYVMTGQYDQPYAWRKNVSGVLPTSKLVLFNIAKD